MGRHLVAVWVVCVLSAAASAAELDLEAAKGYLQGLPLDHYVAESLKVADYKGAGGEFFKAVRWDDAQTDYGVLGDHARSLHNHGDRRRVWSEIARELSMQPMVAPPDSETPGSSGLLAEINSGIEVAQERKALLDVVEGALKTVAEVKLDYTKGGTASADLANKLKHFLSLRKGGKGWSTKLRKWVGDRKMFSNCLELGEQALTYGDLATSAWLLNALATDEATRRADHLTEVAQTRRWDAAATEGITDNLGMLHAVQKTSSWEYLQTFGDHVGELAETIGGKVGGKLASALAKKAGIAHGGSAYYVSAWFMYQSVSALVEQNHVFQQASLFAAAEYELTMALRAEIRNLDRLDADQAQYLLDLDIMRRYARVGYYDRMLAATGTQGPVDVAGFLIRLMSKDIREGRKEFAQERDKALAGLNEAVAARGRLLSGSTPSVAETGSGPKFCHECGAAWRPGAKFCTQCGKPLSTGATLASTSQPRYCHECGLKHSGSATFCRGCGARFSIRGRADAGTREPDDNERRPLTIVRIASVTPRLTLVNTAERPCHVRISGDRGDREWTVPGGTTLGPYDVPDGSYSYHLSYGGKVRPASGTLTFKPFHATTWRFWIETRKSE